MRTHLFEYEGQEDVIKAFIIGAVVGISALVKSLEVRHQKRRSKIRGEVQCREI